MSWNDNVKKVVPYVPGEQPVGTDIIKLNTNENPYPPAPGVVDALKSMEKEYDIYRKYPDPDARVLVKAISEYYGVAENRIFTGVGSDDVLAIAFMTFFNSKKDILFPDISYSFYEVWADLFGIPYKKVPLTGDFRIDPADYMHENGGIIFPNPNAPTGLAMDTAGIESIIKANRDSVVIVDEAYVDFSGESVLPLIDKYDNLLVVQTFSKSRSMAGARIGFAFGSEELIGYMKDVKFSFNSYTMNQDVLRIGAAAVKDREYFETTVSKIVETRNSAAARLKAMGFSGPESSSNFLFVEHDSVPAAYIFDELKKRKIYVRYFPKDRIDNFLRITVGTPEQMEKLYGALEEILNNY